MKALSIQQPWAWLISQGLKDIENRDWKTNFRGTFLIHAGKKIDKDAIEHLKIKFPEISLPEKFKTGGYVGIATITDCVDKSESPWFIGKYGFTLKNPRPIRFIPGKGKLMFFDSGITTKYVNKRTLLRVDEIWKSMHIFSLPYLTYYMGNPNDRT